MGESWKPVSWVVGWKGNGVTQGKPRRCLTERTQSKNKWALRAGCENGPQPLEGPGGQWQETALDFEMLNLGLACVCFKF